jgi:hypothetical protein
VDTFGLTVIGTGVITDMCGYPAHGRESGAVMRITRINGSSVAEVGI